MDFALLIIFTGALATSVECSCYSTTLYATTYSQSKSVTSSPYDYCAFTITSSYGYSTNYYLEISWSVNFDVKGNMPNCRGDYVEVLLSRSRKSIGKFCSNNAGKPFTMYSLDGYARITHSTDGYSTGKGFTFFYKLKSKTSQYLGNSPSSTFCDNSYNYGGSGVIYSSGWPSGYQRSSSPCNYKISRSYSSRGVYVVFMDVNMYPYGSYPLDCVQLYGSNSSYYFTKQISSRLCNTNAIEKYFSYDRYLKVTFDRKNRETFRSSRGFVAGYIVFNTPRAIFYTTPTRRPNSTRAALRDVERSSFIPVVVGVVVGAVVPAMIIIAIFIGIFIYAKRRESYNATTVPLSRNQLLAVTSANQQATPTALFSYPGSAYSQPPTGCHPTESCPVSFTVPASYHTVMQGADGGAPQQFSFTIHPSSVSIPGRALLPPSVPGDRGQQPMAL